MKVSDCTARVTHLQEAFVDSHNPAKAVVGSTVNPAVRLGRQLSILEERTHTMSSRIDTVPEGPDLDVSLVKCIQMEVSDLKVELEHLTHDILSLRDPQGQ